jgi:hypothetical protein
MDDLREHQVYKIAPARPEGNPRGDDDVMARESWRSEIFVDVCGF